MKIILCGLKSCGKTTFGKRAAKRLNWKFLDSDEMIEQAYSKQGIYLSCRDIYLKEGSSFFRQFEREQIEYLANFDEVIFALGGGAVCDPIIAEKIRNLGVVIYLKTSPEVIWDRIKQNGIPAFLDRKKPEESFHEMVKIRIPFYETIAHEIVDTDSLNDEQILLAIIKNRSHSNGKQFLRHYF